MRNASLSRRNVLLSALSFLIVAALGTGLWAEMSNSYADRTPRLETTHSPGTASAEHTFLIDCSHRARVRPRRFDIACGGDGATLTHIRWASWGTSSARGSATFAINVCEPDCASDNVKRYPVRVVVDHVANGNGTGRFKKMHLSFPKAAPPEAHRRRSTIDLDSLRGN